MKRTIFVMVVALLAVFMGSAVFGAQDAWTIDISASAPPPVISGTFTFGVSATALDGKDGSDANQPPSPSPSLSVVTTHPDQPSVARDFRQDMRTAWTTGTKIWSNLLVKTSGLAEGDVVTLAWKRSTTAVPPAGTYKLVNTETGQVFDMGSDGSTEITVPAGRETGNLAIMRIIVKFGTAIEPSSVIRVGAVGRKVVSSPAVDEAGNIFAGIDDGKLYKVAAGGTTATALTIAPGANTEIHSVKGRVAYYGGKIYVTAGRAVSGVTSARLTAYNASDGSVVFGPIDIPGATSYSTPAVDPATGNIYVGTNSHIVRVSSTGTSPASRDLGITAPSNPTTYPYPWGVFAPAVPGTDMVWVTAGTQDVGKLFCLTSDLATVKTTVDIASPLTSAPSVQSIGGNLVVIATGGNTLKAFNAVNGAAAGTYTATEKIACTPFFTGSSQAFFTTADGKVAGINLVSMANLPNFPVTLPPTWQDSTRFSSTGAVSWLDASPVAAGGKLFVAAGNAGNGNFIIDIASGAVTMTTGGDAAGSSPTLTADRTKVIFGNRDGHLYVYDTGL